MANKQVTLTGSKSFSDIGTIGQNADQLAGNMQSVDQILNVGLRNTRNLLDSFVRVSDLVALGIATLSGNTLTFGGPVLNGASVVSALPAAPTVGDRAFVTDAHSTTFLAAAVGGGTNKVPVVYTGAGWVIG